MDALRVQLFMLRASHVLTLLQREAHDFGLPSKVRCDRAVENIEVARFMLNRLNRASITAGHSSKILWEFNCVVSYYFSYSR